MDDAARRAADARRQRAYKARRRAAESSESRRIRLAAEATYQRKWRARNREKIKTYMAAWRIKHPMASRPAARRWWDANREHINAQHRAWIKKNPETGRHHVRLRRARRLSAPGSHTRAEWFEKCALLGNVCFYCGEAKPLAAEHKVPLTRGGANRITNIVAACKSCNSRKHNLTASEFLALP